MEKEKFKKKIDQQLIANIDGVIDSAEYITSEMNKLIGSIRYLFYLQYLKDYINNDKNL